jgi:o-succinylbenzoate synthase
MHCYYKKYTLHFKIPAGTSRNTLHTKDTYFIFLQNGNKTAIGECNLFAGLSYDDRPEYENKLAEICQRLPFEKEGCLNELKIFPSICFGVETVLKDYNNGCKQQIFPEVINEDGFSVPINGLIWMGTQASMQQQIAQKLDAGYTSIKLKIGAIDFETELALIKYIRKQFPEKEVEVRLDANGAFNPLEAIEKLNKLAEFNISYIEQPIMAGQWQEMAKLVEKSPIKIALDEELIGIITEEKQTALLQTIQPDLLVLKPALIGGFDACTAWKKKIKAIHGDWVITSALESNIGLNAIAQYAALEHCNYAQGLGTGQLYTNNIPSPYTVDAKGLHYHTNKSWNFSILQ